MADVEFTGVKVFGVEVARVEIVEIKTEIRSLNDIQLHERSKNVAEKERAVTLELLHCLSEVEVRHLYSKFACSSLRAYCVKQLKMSDGQAGRRVAASRLLREVPGLQKQILSGDLSVTSAAQAAVFFQKESRAGNKIAHVEKIAIIQSLENKSTREVMESLLALSPNPQIHSQESMKPRSDGYNEVRLLLDAETMQALERLKEIYSHREPSGSLGKLVKLLATDCLKRVDPLLKAERKLSKHNSAPALERAGTSARMNLSEPADVRFETEAYEETALVAEDLKAATSKRVALPAKVKHAVILRDRGRCTFVDANSGVTCGEKKFLEFDHIVPVSHGGQGTVNNLRLLCRTHNARAAIETLGWSVMQPYLFKSAN